MRLIRAIATLTLAISAAALVAETDKSKGLEIMNFLIVFLKSF